jgi:hypothetical protein
MMHDLIRGHLRGVCDAKGRVLLCWVKCVGSISKVLIMVVLDVLVLVLLLLVHGCVASVVL